MNEDLIKTYRDNPSELYGDAFFHNCRKSRAFQNEFSSYFVKRFSVSSVLDMGCACGWYLEGFKKINIDVLGVEYVYDVAKKYFPDSIKGDIIFGDLTKDINVGRKFDLVMSFEVAEHLPSGTDEVYVGNITRHASNMILFSVADNEKGNFHINIKPKKYWLDLFNSKGFVVSDEHTKIARNIYSEIPIRNPYKNYMAKTVFMLFAK